MSAFGLKCFIKVEDLDRPMLIKPYCWDYISVAIQAAMSYLDDGYSVSRTGMISVEVDGEKFEFHEILIKNLMIKDDRIAKDREKLKLLLSDNLKMKHTLSTLANDVLVKTSEEHEVVKNENTELKKTVQHLESVVAYLETKVVK